MPGRQIFLTAEWSERWKASYVRLSPERQAACDRAAIALIKRESSPGLRINPILPKKYYFEARLSHGDRIVFRIEGGTINFINLVTHVTASPRFGQREIMDWTIESMG